MSKCAEAHAGSIYPWKRDGVQVGWAGAADVTGSDGKRRRKVVYAKSQKEAREKLNAKSELPTAGRMNLEAWLRKWLDLHGPAGKGSPSAHRGLRARRPASQEWRTIPRRRCERLATERTSGRYRP